MLYARSSAYSPTHADFGDSMSGLQVLANSKKDLYVEAAREVHHRAVSERHPQAREILLDIERSFQRLAEIEKCSRQPLA